MKCVKILADVDGVDWNAEMSIGDTPIMWCLKNSKKDIFKVLADCPRVDLNVKDTAGDTPAMWALKSDQFEMFNILVDYPRTDLDLKDSSDDTLALWALKNDKIETLKQLVGRVNVSMTDKNGDTVAKIARFASDRYLDVVLYSLVGPN